MAGNNNVHRGPARDKPFRAALVRALGLAEGRQDKLDEIASGLLADARVGDNRISAIREIADRLDGKPAQAIVGDDDHDPVRTITEIVTRIVDPKDV